MLPPIRYPLPMLVLLILVVLVSWRGEAWTRPLRSAVAGRMARAVEGPPLPHSDQPQVVAGPITRRALLLHDGVTVADRPDARPSQARTIAHRMFVDVYDVWPLQGAPDHYRVGNRRPVGWVDREDVLLWDTRLVLRAVGQIGQSADGRSLPVLDWRPDAVQVAVWDDDRPWSEVARTTWLPTADLPAASWGVWLTREELLALIPRTMTAPPLHLRLRTLLGRLLDNRPLTDEDVQTARAALPAQAFAIRAATPGESRERLARVNEHWAPEASWGGLSFQLVPLEAMP
jgi:hypothetical protein